MIRHKIPCVILCGGKSSRMGEDKALLPFGSYDSLAQYQYERLKTHFEKVYISSKIDKFDFLENQDDLILDEGTIYSPLIALETIFNAVNDDKIFIITVDTPLVSLQTISTLINKSITNDICVAKTQKVHNLCGVFSKNIKENLDLMLQNDNHRVSDLLKNNNSKIIEFSNNDEFINLNKQDEYQKALQIINCD